MNVLIRKFRSKTMYFSYFIQKEKKFRNILLSLVFFSLLYLISLTENFDSPKDTKIFSNFKKKKWPLYLPPSYGEHIKSFNLSSLSKKERKYIKNYMTVMKRRVDTVGNFCSNHPDLGVPGDIIHLVWVRRNDIPNIAWCCNFKVGSGSWTANFLRTAHFNENNTDILALPEKDRDLARFQAKYGANFATIYKVFSQPKTNMEKIESFSNSIRFLVVRHPFTRILSAFRNVIEMSIPTLEDEPFYKELRKHIIKNFRTNTKNKSDFPTFPEFIDYLINITKNVKTAEEWNKRGEFYWEPFWAHCHVCASDYNVIIKLETMKDDEKFLAILGNLTEVKQRKKAEWRHVIKEKTSFDLAENYFKLLSVEQVLDLYDIFKYDFELFNYDLEKYLRVAAIN